jgi:hypothetical protein
MSAYFIEENKIRYAIIIASQSSTLLNKITIQLINELEKQEFKIIVFTKQPAKYNSITQSLIFIGFKIIISDNS